METPQDNISFVSVITIFFNAAKYLNEAASSVYDQSYGSWELLLVDDGSVDGSTEIAKRLAQEDPVRVRYLEHPEHQNRGMSSSRNLGIVNARGVFVAFLDSDDVWLPNKLEGQLGIIHAHPDVAMIFGAPQYWYGWTGKTEDIQKDYIPNHGMAADTVYKAGALLPLIYPLGKASAPCPSDLLIRRQCIDKVGGFEEHFEGIYQLYEDQAFLAKVYLTHNVYVSSQNWLKYRIHAESCQSVVTASGNYEKVRLYFLNWFKSYLTEREYKDESVWMALEQALVSTALGKSKGV